MPQVLSYPLPEFMEKYSVDIRQLAILTGIPAPTLYKNFQGKTKMTLQNGLKVIFALKLYPSKTAFEILTEMVNLYTGNDDE